MAKADRDTIRTVVEKIRHSTLADVVGPGMIDVLEDKDSNYEQILRELTPSMALRFLVTANASSNRREVRSIAYAVKLLGYKQMQAICHEARMMPAAGFPEYFSFDRFLAQARFCAEISQVLSDILEYRGREEVYTAATFQNIGKLFIVTQFPKEHRTIVTLKQKRGVSTTVAERAVLGIGHSEIGALILKRFNVPGELCEAVRYHNAKNMRIRDGADFELELIAREASRIAARFQLPIPGEVGGRLGPIVPDARNACRIRSRLEMRNKGYQQAFSALLTEASAWVVDGLKIFLSEHPRT